MSQQRPARRLPSLLVDPAEETVRRRCRDPINVEGLLVSSGSGAGWGLGPSRRSPSLGSRTRCPRGRALPLGRARGCSSGPPYPPSPPAAHRIVRTKATVGMHLPS